MGKRKFKENKKYGFIAGPMFNEADINFRSKQAKLLSENTNIDWYNPSNDGLKAINLPSASDIFWEETKEILKSEYVLADLSNLDPGVCYELGVTWAINYIRDILKRNNKAAIELLDKYRIRSKKVVAIISDSRLKCANKYHDHFVPAGVNQYVVGGVLDQGWITDSTFEAIKLLSKITINKTIKKSKKNK